MAGQTGVFSRGQTVSTYGAEDIAIDLMEVMAEVDWLENAPADNLIIFFFFFFFFANCLFINSAPRALSEG